MNTKTIILIASVLTVLGLLGGIIFGALTLANALLIAPAILGILYGIYERFEKVKVEKIAEELKWENIAYSSTLDSKEKEIKDLKRLELDLSKTVLHYKGNGEVKDNTIKVLEDEIVELRSKLYDAEISNQIDKASTVKSAPLNLSPLSEETNNKPKTQRRGPRKENK